MMAAGVSKLPDFSKGEETGFKAPSEFQPLFGPSVDPHAWSDEPPADNDDGCDDLAALMSELNQLPVDPAGNDDGSGSDQEGEIDDPNALTPDYHADQIEQSNQLDQPGVAELPSVSQEDHDDAIEALRQAHAEELERVQNEHNQQVLQQLDTLQHGLMDDVAAHIEQQLATSLAPLFKTDIARTSLDQLLTEIRRIVQTEAVEKINLTGPDPLVKAASLALAGGSQKIEVEPSENADLVVHLNQKILSTCIEDWSRKVEEALGA
ncbi:MAG: hypothetical protein ABJH63_17605 [Rhizobiaceae bacterium]